MENKGIFGSRFIRAFVNEYYEDKWYSYYPEKDRLLFALCDTDEERNEVALKEIKIAKSKIKALGYEHLSSAYLLSCKQESAHNFIAADKRYDFWLNRVVQDFEENFQSFHPIHDALLILTNKKELELDCFHREDEFWEFYPKRLCPKIQDLILVISNETELEAEIQFSIDEYNNKEWWEIDFEELEKYVEVSKPMEELFKVSELFVQLERLVMLKDSLSPQKTIEKAKKINAPVIALFCSLINDIRIDKKGETESIATFCSRICKKYKLPYADKVRQNYQGVNTKKHRNELVQQIFPLLDAETKIEIQKHLSSKYPPKENLYT